MTKIFTNMCSPQHSEHLFDRQGRLKRYAVPCFTAPWPRLPWLFGAAPLPFTTALPMPLPTAFPLGGFSAAAGAVGVHGCTMPVHAPPVCAIQLRTTPADFFADSSA